MTESSREDIRDILPHNLRELASIAADRLDRDGYVLEDHRGFALLDGGRATADTPWPAASLFIQPSFRLMCGRLAVDGTGDP